VRAGIFVTYATLAWEPGAASRRISDAFQSARRTRGLRSVWLLRQVEDSVALLEDALRTGAMTPNEALHRLVGRVRFLTGGTVRGWAAETEALDELTLPERAFAPYNHTAVLMAAPYRPSGDAWWHWAVVVVVVRD
jgi:hypothetical protein